MKTRLVLNSPFDRLWSGSDAFVRAAELDGEEFRRVKSRRTFRFEVEGRGFFMKFHRGVGWREIFKNLSQFKLPVLGAGNEFCAINRLKMAGVDTMTTAAYGERGCDPAHRLSFLVTEELSGMTSLEDFCRDWAANPPEFKLRRAVIARLGWTAGRMHAAGVNHRDCYLCHFLLDETCLEAQAAVRLYVIDLHRAQLRSRVPRRYRVKDLAGLWFSAVDCGLRRRDVLRFAAAYLAENPELRGDHALWHEVRSVAAKLYFKERRTLPPELR